MKRHTMRSKAALVTTALALTLTGCEGGLSGGDSKKTPTVGNRTPILSTIQSGASVDPALAGVSVVLPPAAPNQEWAQVGGSASKSYGHLALAANPSRLWTVRIDGSNERERLAAAPVVGRRRI